MAAAGAETATRPSGDIENTKATIGGLFLFVDRSRLGSRVHGPLRSRPAPPAAGAFVLARPMAAGTGRAAIRVLPGLCDKVRQVARFIAVVGGDVDLGPRSRAVRMDCGITDLGQDPTASEGVGLE